MLNKALTLAATAALAVATSHAADRWGSPPAVRQSPDGASSLSTTRVEGKIMLTLKKRRENGWTFVWSALSPQEHEPYQVHFAPDGQHLVLQDEWGRVGRGVVLAFLGPKGNTLSAYTLGDLLPESDPARWQSSISSTWWIARGHIAFRRGGSELAFVTSGGTYRCFDVQTGKANAMTKPLAESIRSEFSAQARGWLKDKDPAHRISGAALAATLEDESAVPLLMALLNDSYSARATVREHTHVPDGTYDCFPVQTEAGMALARLAEAELLPTVEARIRGSSPYMAYQWAGMLWSSKSPKSEAFWKRLAASDDPWMVRLAEARSRRSG